jgi:hypothetical protein
MQGSVAQTSEQENWVFRHLVLVGTLVGTGAGGIVAANAGYGHSAIILGGTAAGAYGGLVASAIHKARTDQPVGEKTKIGIVLGAIGIAIGSLVVVSGYGQ